MKCCKINPVSRLVPRVLCVATWSLVLVSGSAHAGIIFDSLVKDDLDAIHRDLANAVLFTTTSAGDRIGSKDFGMEFGFSGGLTSAESILAETEDAGSADPLPALLPMLMLYGGASVPLGFTVEFNWRPNFTKWIGLDFSSAYYGGSVRWSPLSLIGIEILNLDVGAHYGYGFLDFGQTIASVVSDIDTRRHVYGFGTTGGLNLGGWFRPFVYLGVARSDLEITATNAGSVFSSLLTTNNRAESSVTSVVGRLGSKFVTPIGSISFEYQRAFSADRFIVGIASYVEF